MVVEHSLRGVVAIDPGTLIRGQHHALGVDSDDGYSVVRGVAVIPICGTLYQYSQDDGTGYDWIKSNFLKALGDPAIDAIVLAIDSGGGEVAGCFDLVDLIYHSRAVKPLLAICAESAYSAAYALASACERVTVPRTGGVGSVGVIAVHTDRSSALSKSGLNVSLISYGDRKADGSEVQPLSIEAKSRMQADVNVMGELFVSTVARNRGLSESAVRATQAATYTGRAAVAVGFADAVFSPDAAFLDLAEQLEASR